MAKTKSKHKTHSKTQTPSDAASAVPAALPPPKHDSGYVYEPKGQTYERPWLESSSMVQQTDPLKPPPIAPIVYYTDLAWAKIRAAVQHCSEEVGWLGIVEQMPDGNYLIEDIFIPKQTVTAATTSIEDKGEIMFYMVKNDIPIEKLRYWGHSHVHMAVSPSTTDERQVQDYVEELSPGDFYIRGIYNKNGKAKVDVYEIEDEHHGWVHQCVTNKRMPPVLDNKDEFLAEIDKNVKVTATYRRTVRGTRHPSSGDVIVYPGKEGVGTDGTAYAGLSGYRTPKTVEVEGKVYTEDDIYALEDAGVIGCEAAQQLLDELDVTEEQLGDPFFAKDYVGPKE